LQTPSFEEYDYSSLQMLISAGAPLTSQLKTTIIEKFNTNLFEFFGSSETSSYITLHPEHVIRKAASIGQQSPSTEVRLVDNNGNDVEIGEEGEFAVRGPTLFDGYYNLPEITKESYLE